MSWKLSPVVFCTFATCATSANAQVPVRGVDESLTGTSIVAGGEVRQEYEWFDNEEWGAEVPDSSGYWLQRYMLYADTRLSRRVRLYGELKSGIEVGRAGGPRGSDEDRLDLNQAFVDVSFGPVTVRAGRQELVFGTQRLISGRDGPNVRQAFDGGTVVLQRGRWRTDGFASRYVSTETGVFDDSPDTGRSLWGVYAVRSLAQDKGKGVDLVLPRVSPEGRDVRSRAGPRNPALLGRSSLADVGCRRLQLRSDRPDRPSRGYQHPCLGNCFRHRPPHRDSVWAPATRAAGQHHQRRSGSRRRSARDVQSAVPQGRVLRSHCLGRSVERDGSASARDGQSARRPHDNHGLVVLLAAPDR